MCTALSFGCLQSGPSFLKWASLGAPGLFFPNSQAPHQDQNPIPSGWVVVRCCEAFGGPRSGGRGTAKGQVYQLLHTRLSQMMVNSHLRSSRITLPMGFLAPGSCGSCSAALMGILPSEYERGMKEPWVDVRPGCPHPTVSPATLVPYGEWGGRGYRGEGGDGRERGGCQGSVPTFTRPRPPCLQPCPSHCFELGPQNSQA